MYVVYIYIFIAWEILLTYLPLSYHSEIVLPAVADTTAPSSLRKEWQGGGEKSEGRREREREALEKNDDERREVSSLLQGAVVHYCSRKKTIHRTFNFRSPFARSIHRVSESTGMAWIPSFRLNPPFLAALSLCPFRLTTVRHDGEKRRPVQFSPWCLSWPCAMYRITEAKRVLIWAYGPSLRVIMKTW